MSDPFVTHRGLLFTVTYEMLSSAADAEDVVQEAWLRWTRVDKAEVRDPRAYLVRVVTRLALDRLRTLSRRREDYVGEWLPEPLLTTPDVAEDVELAENISIAMLTVLETLAPTERAVFVLRDVFGFSYDDIAESLAKSTVAVRQIAHRAREHIAARRPRMEVRSTEHEQVVETFMAAAVSGDLDGLLEVLAPDVVLTADGGGAAAAVRKPVAGAETVARLLCSFAAVSVDSQYDIVMFNGSPALRVMVDGQVDTAISFSVHGGRINRIYAMRNPQKLAGTKTTTQLSRA